MKKYKIELSEYQISILLESLDDFIDYWTEQQNSGVDVDQTFMHTMTQLEKTFRAKLIEVGY